MEALKLNFKRDELPGLSRIVIMERKKKTMDVKWISREQAERVTSVWEPMSYPFNGDECEFDEQNIFITPSSSFFYTLREMVHLSQIQNLLPFIRGAQHSS